MQEALVCVNSEWLPQVAAERAPSNAMAGKFLIGSRLETGQKASW